jgi:hypothetical protein
VENWDEMTLIAFVDTSTSHPEHESKGFPQKNIFKCGKFLEAEKQALTPHDTYAFHHEFTSEKPPSAHRFSGYPLQKHQQNRKKSPLSARQHFFSKQTGLGCLNGLEE